MAGTIPIQSDCRREFQIDVVRNVEDRACTLEISNLARIESILTEVIRIDLLIKAVIDTCRNSIEWNG